MSYKSPYGGSCYPYSSMAVLLAIESSLAPASQHYFFSNISGLITGQPLPDQLRPPGCHRLITSFSTLGAGFSIGLDELS
ncbi:hypothetical protein L2E82_06751 [Cichorium intybus]|uniref:Uncharacterized protein n=1 Tax=Cichorium intybus TaxID=13427 RepID=A0ACB9HCG1_CICIN|nr:hypothetical protein L2E82_06751 [Cichorium intybus]